MYNHQPSYLWHHTSKKGVHHSHIRSYKKEASLVVCKESYTQL